jgi:hypothetical protein
MGGAGTPSNLYSLNASTGATFTMGQTVTISANGGDFTGHLIGASSGTFSGFRSSACDSKTVSHSSTSVVTDGTQFTWTPESCESVNFRGLFHDDTTNQMYRTELLTLTCNGSAKLFASFIFVLFSIWVSVSTASF